MTHDESCDCETLEQLRQDLEVLASCLLPERRVCGFCGDRDPMWHGKPSGGWTVRDGRDRCPDCGWLQSGPNP